MQWLSCFPSPGAILTKVRRTQLISWEKTMLPLRESVHYCALWQLANHKTKWKHLLLLCSFSQGTPSVWPDEGFKEPICSVKGKVSCWTGLRTEGWLPAFKAVPLLEWLSLPTASLPPFLSPKLIASVQLLWKIACNAHGMKHRLIHRGNCTDIF